MIKRTFFLLAISALFFACNNDVKQATDEGEALPVVTVEEFEAKAADYVGQVVNISGTVDHTCKHSGKRMVILGANPEYTLKIEAGEVDQFNRELEGSDVSVNGLVTELRIDENYLNEWEEEIRANHADDEDGGEAALADVNYYREEVAKSDKGYVGIYGMDCVNYKVIKEGPPAAKEVAEEEEDEHAGHDHSEG